MEYSDNTNIDIASICAVTEKMQDALKCSICLDLLNCPVTTRCGHSFCSLCLDKMFDQCRSSVTCPLCAAPMTKRSLHQNKKIISLVNAVRNIISSMKQDLGYKDNPKNKEIYLPEVPVSYIAKEEVTVRRGTRKRENVVPFCPEIIPNKKKVLTIPCKRFEERTSKNITKTTSMPNLGEISTSISSKTDLNCTSGSAIESNLKVKEWLDSSAGLVHQTESNDDETLPPTQIFNLGVLNKVYETPINSMQHTTEPSFSNQPKTIAVSMNEHETIEKDIEQNPKGELKDGKENDCNHMLSPKKKTSKRVLVEKNDENQPKPEVEDKLNLQINENKFTSSKQLPINGSNAVIDPPINDNDSIVCFQEPNSSNLKHNPNRKGHNIRFASEMKKSLQDVNPKPSKLSVSRKTKKSPGWSHIESVKRDLRSKHTSLNIKGGEDKFIIDSNKSNQNSVLEESSQETVVVIDDGTQIDKSQTEGNEKRGAKLKKFVSSFTNKSRSESHIDGIKRRAKSVLPRNSKKKDAIIEPLPSDDAKETLSCEKNVADKTLLGSSMPKDDEENNRHVSPITADLIDQCSILMKKNSKKDNCYQINSDMNNDASIGYNNSKENNPSEVEKVPPSANSFRTQAKCSVLFEAKGQLHPRNHCEEARDLCHHTIPCSTFQMLMSFSKQMVETYSMNGSCYTKKQPLSPSNDAVSNDCNEKRNSFLSSPNLDLDITDSVTKRQQKMPLHSSNISSNAFIENPSLSEIVENSVDLVGTDIVPETNMEERSYKENPLGLSFNAPTVIQREEVSATEVMEDDAGSQFSDSLLPNLEATPLQSCSENVIQNVQLPNLTQPSITSSFVIESSALPSLNDEKKVPYKRIRNVISSDESEDEDNMSHLKRSSKKSRNVLIDSQKELPSGPLANSEELRDYERYDQNIWDYYRNRSDIKLDSILNEKEDAIINKSITDDKLRDTLEESSDEDCIPGTEEVFKKAKKGPRDARKDLVDLASQDTSCSQTSEVSHATKELLTKCKEINNVAKGIMDEQRKRASEITAHSETSNRDKQSRSVSSILNKPSIHQSKKANALQPPKKMTRSTAMMKFPSAVENKIVFPDSNVQITRDSDQESEELFMSMPGDKKNTAINIPQRPTLVITCTGLSNLEIDEVKNLVELYGDDNSVVKGVWDRSVTHVIARADESGVADRTLKYLYGVVHGVWVISFKWVRESLKASTLLSEEPFEVLDCTTAPGPEKSRLAKQRNLFRNCQFALLPPFANLTQQQITELIETCGGTVVSSPLSFNNRSKGMKLILLDSESQEIEKLISDHSRKKVLVAHDWVVECIGMFALVAIPPYILGQPADFVIKASGITDAIMTETQDFIEKYCE